MKFKVLLQKEIEIDTEDEVLCADNKINHGSSELTAALQRGERCFFTYGGSGVKATASDLVIGDHLFWMDPDWNECYAGRIVGVERIK